MSCPQSSRGSGPGVWLLTPDFCITAPFPSLLGTIFALAKVHGSSDRLGIRKGFAGIAAQPRLMVSLCFSRRM